MGLGQRKEAIAAFREAALLAPDVVEIYQRLGEALADEGQRDEAIAELWLPVLVAAPDDIRPRQALERVLNAAKAFK